MKEHLKIAPGERTEALFDELERSRQRPWTSKEHPEVAAWLKLNEKPLAVVVAASKRTQYFAPVRSLGTLTPPFASMQMCRSVSYALVSRALLHTAQKEYDTAWQNLLACHRLARLIGKGALMEQLLAMATESTAAAAALAFLEHAALDSKQINKCLREFQDLRATSAMADTIDLGERFTTLTWCKGLNPPQSNCLPDCVSRICVHRYS